MNRNHEAGHTPVHSEMERCVLCWEGQLCARCYYELYGAGVFRRTQDAE